MRALEFVRSVPRFLLVRGLGGALPALATSPLAPLRLRDDLPEPRLPGPAWVRLDGVRSVRYPSEALEGWLAAQDACPMRRRA